MHTFDGDTDIPSARATVESWATLNGCAAPSDSATRDIDAATPGEETTVTRFAGCRANRTVELPKLAATFGDQLLDLLLAHAKSP